MFILDPSKWNPDSGPIVRNVCEICNPAFRDVRCTVLISAFVLINLTITLKPLARILPYVWVHFS